MFRRLGGTRLEVADVVAAIGRVRDGVEGVTLLGGEPFDQAAALAEVARAARALGLSVMTFTGYTLEALRARRDPGTRALLAATDLLVDGPYVAARPERARRWVGSTNQRFHFLTGRYAPGIEAVPAGAPAETVEVSISPDGRVAANGWPALDPEGATGAASPSPYGPSRPGTTPRSSPGRAPRRAPARARRSPRRTPGPSGRA
jgi:anaerobic ribonucleoside-triphosphate reductase activating protein